MRIIVPAIGSRGDVQPYIALCQGLQEAGHNVQLATNPTLAALVDSYGVPVVPVGKPVDMDAGPQFVHRADLDSQRLAAAIERATSDKTVQDKAAIIGKCIRSEPDGVTEAVKWIEVYSVQVEPANSTA